MNLVFNGDFLRQLLKTHKINQGMLEKELNLGPTYVSKLCIGAVRNPNNDKIKLIADYFNSKESSDRYTVDSFFIELSELAGRGVKSRKKPRVTKQLSLEPTIVEQKSNIESQNNKVETLKSLGLDPNKILYIIDVFQNGDFLVQSTNGDYYRAKKGLA